MNALFARRHAQVWGVVAALVAVGHSAQLAAAEAKLLVTHGLFLTMAEGQRTPFSGYMLVGEDGRIVKIAAGDAPPAAPGTAVYDAGGKFIVPGFVSSHSHIWQSANRGLGADKTLLDWIGAFMPYTNAASPEDLYWFTLHGCLDFTRYGITSAYNFTYEGGDWNGYEKPAAQKPGNWEQEQFRGELESGLRFIHSFGVRLLDKDAEIRQAIDEFIDYTKPYQNNPRFLKLALSGGVAFSRNKQTAYQEAAIMRDYHLDNQTHFLEPPNALSQRDKFAWMQESGMLAFGPGLYFGHFIHTTPEIVAACSKAGCNMSWQPLSNGRLASGIADIPAYLKAGMKVGMGVDDQCASDIPDPFENMRMGLYAIRDKYEDASIMSVYDVLKLQTMGSATVMRVADKIGSLEVGKFADFNVIDPRRRDTGPVYDPYATLVLACGQSNLERTYIGGELACLRGEVMGRDFNAVADEVHRRADANRVKVEASASARVGVSAPPAPSREQIETLVKGMVKAWETGDADQFGAALSDKVLFAYPGDRLNKEQLMDTFKKYQQEKKDIKIYFGRFLVQDNRFAMTYQFAATDRTSGIRQAIGTAAGGTVEDGKLVVFKEFFDEHVAKRQASGEIPLDEGQVFPYPASLMLNPNLIN